MVKRKQDKIKDFRGDRNAIRRETDEWMAGSGGKVTRRSQQAPPPFQVPATSRKRAPLLTKETSKKAATKNTKTTEPIPTIPSVPSLPLPVSQLESDEDEEEDEDEGIQQPYAEVNDSEVEDNNILEEQIQVVTPKSKTKQTVEEVVLSVVEYQAVIAEYKDRLWRAERQVRAISKTNLADKFMENEVRKYVKESLWNRCKFITCPETMEDCMTEVASQFAIPLDKREHWKSTYAHAVRDALNNRRNNTSQDLKKELTGT
jgi:hypothetical protein